MVNNNIPSELKERGLFCLWRKELTEDGRLIKVPYNVKTGGRAQSNNIDTLVTFDELKEADTTGYDGFMVKVGNDISGIDIDDCVSRDEHGAPILSELAQDIINIMDTYTEYSPSGMGIRMFFLTDDFQYDKEKYYLKNPLNHVEVYISGTTNRFLTVTGNAINNCSLKKCHEQLGLVLDNYMQRPERLRPVRDWSNVLTPITLPDGEVLRRVELSQNGDKFKALFYEGDTQPYNYDDSSADLALCGILSFWCGRNAEQIDRLFRRSKLMREKWNELRGVNTYGNITIQKAVDGCREVYTPANDNEPEYWELPIPFDTIDAPDFPVDALPEPIAAFVKALAESTQTPLEMPAILSLGVLSAAVQRRYKIEINADWSEALNLYAVAIAPPGERKSAVISALTAPLYEYERERINLEEAQVLESQAIKRSLEKALSLAEKAGSIDEIRVISDQLSSYEEKHTYCLLVDDTTPEKLIEIMAAQGGKIAMASAEGGVFDIMRGRYDANTSIDVYLKSYTGEPLRVDRLGRTTNNINNPYITMILTLQPSVIQKAMRNETFRGRGLMGRFLYVIARSYVGQRNVRPQTIPTDIKNGYSQLMMSLLNAPDEGTIKLSPEAEECMCGYAKIVEHRLAEEWEPIREWAGKLVGNMLRIAALIHCCVCESPTGNMVTVNTVECAIKIAECLSTHAVSAFKVFSNSYNVDDAQYLLGKIRASEVAQISKRDLFQLANGKYHIVKEMEPGLEVLEAMGYIRLHNKRTGGRPSNIIYINPHIA